jgi:hypothetical protein
MTTSSDKTPNQTKSHADRYDIPTLETKDDLVSAMKDARYATEHRYREGVAQRVSEAVAAGRDLNLSVVHNGTKLVGGHR